MVIKTLVYENILPLNLLIHAVKSSHRPERYYKRPSNLYLS